MNPELRIDTIKRMLRLIDEKTCQFGEEGSVAVSDYTEPSVVEKELDSIFKNFPILVAHASDLVEPGSYISIDIGHVPVLVNRDRDGQLNAFINSCRHRGARLVTDRKGTARTFKCPYHAWTYLDQGDLKHVPRQDAFPSLETSECGLKKLHVAEAGGLFG